MVLTWIGVPPWKVMHFVLAQIGFHHLLVYIPFLKSLRPVKLQHVNETSSDVLHFVFGRETQGACNGFIGSSAKPLRVQSTLGQRRYQQKKHGLAYVLQWVIQEIEKSFHVLRAVDQLYHRKPFKCLIYI